MDEILPNLGMELPDIGSDQDTWGDILNANLRILDNAVTYDAITKTLAATDVTLTAAEAAHGVINLDGTLTANVNLIVPVSPVRLYLVNNGTTGAFTVTVKTPLGTGITVLQGANSLVYSNGTNIVQGATSVNGSFSAGNTSVANLSYTGTLTGGTGVINIGSGQLVKDAAGNLGLGVTPSAWSGITALQINSQGALSSVGGFVGLGANNYFDGSVDRYITTGAASQYAQSASTHIWRTAPSGTAGNPITFTQAMTLTQGGNLLVGTTGDNGNRAQIQGNTSASARLLVAHTGNDATQFASISVGVGGNGEFQIQTIPGNAGQGVAFVQAGIVERARITSGGYFKASNTGSYISSTGVFHEFSSNSSSAALVARNTNTVADAFATSLPSGSTGFHTVSQTNGITVYQVLANGNVQNTNNSYGAISDARLKENVVDASSYLDRFMQVRFRNFNFIGSDLKQFGVIAQELETVFPGLVDESPDFEQVTKTRTVEVPAVEEVRDEEGNVVTEAQPAKTREEEYTESVPTGTVTKSVKYSVLALMAGKVIQEQQQIINDLLKRVEALESK